MDGQMDGWRDRQMDGWIHTHTGKEKSSQRESSKLVLALTSQGFHFLYLSPTCSSAWICQKSQQLSKDHSSDTRWKAPVVNTLGAYPDSLLASTLTCQFLWVLAHNSQLSPSLKIYSQPNGKHLMKRLCQQLPDCRDWPQPITSWSMMDQHKGTKDQFLASKWDQIFHAIQAQKLPPRIRWKLFSS